MRGIGAKIRDFILTPIVLGTIFLFILLAFGTGLLWIGEISYTHPGPAIAVGMFAFAVLIIGLTINAKDRELSQHINALQVPNSELLSPRLIGLELLVERWQSFAPVQPDSVILHEQFSIALSIARLAYNHVEELHFTKFFNGFKIKGGAFLLQPGQIRPLVLKFDSVANIEAETERYKCCVAGRLSLTSGEPMIPRQQYGKIEGEKWGAIIYNLIGADRADYGRIQTFAEYYLAHDIHQEITAVLKKIFESLRPWWQNSKDLSNCQQWKRNSLYGEYDRLTRYQGRMERGVAKAAQVIRIEALQNITANHRYVDLGDSLMIRNPFNWIRDKFEARRADSWISQVGLRLDSIVHGDLHSGNIVISEDNYGQLRAWIIDFPHAHVGPTVQDLARLEADLKFGLLLDDTFKGFSLKDLYDLETSLLPQSAQSIPTFRALTPDQLPPQQQTSHALQKTWEAVRLLRNEARRYMIGNDARPYYLALLHATMPALYYRDRSPWQKLYAFIAAGLLCEYLGG